MDNPTQLNS